MPPEDMRAGLKQLSLPDADKLTLGDVISIYEALRSQMPSFPSARQTRHADRLVDLIGQVDALILDGYGVINVGDGPVDGIEDLIAAAAKQDVPIIVLTNGASNLNQTAWQKYADWNLPIALDQIVSSRNAMEQVLAERNLDSTGPQFGSFGKMVTPLGYAGELRYGYEDAMFEQAEEFVFLGSVGWSDSDQAALEMSLRQHPRRIHVANPDVAAPQMHGFSAEPGYWAARAIQNSDAPVTWYGKPYDPAFALAFDRLEAVTGRRFEKNRVAMVGDSLHTDILGGAAFGLRTILLTDYGLFRDGGARNMAAACGIHPDWMVRTL
jgi:HAD superfamily hydrolase (TIGR01450 family)